MTDNGIELSAEDVAGGFRGRAGRVCVFAGASLGDSRVYQASARALGRCIAHRGLELVYGGACVGLMSIVADAALDAGGAVIGVIPRMLARPGRLHTGLTKLHLVESMHERKALMADLADGFIALPGGIGTLEELFEMWTWTQLGAHRKPCGLLNVAGYYSPLLGFLDSVVARGFLTWEHRAILLASEAPDDLVDRLWAGRQAPPAGVNAERAWRGPPM